MLRATLSSLPMQLLAEAQPVVGVFEGVEGDQPDFAAFEYGVGKALEVFQSAAVEEAAVATADGARELQALDLADLFGLQHNGAGHARVLQEELCVQRLLFGGDDESFFLFIKHIEGIRTPGCAFARSARHSKDVVFPDEFYNSLVDHTLQKYAIIPILPSNLRGERYVRWLDSSVIIEHPGSAGIVFSAEMRGLQKVSL